MKGPEIHPVWPPKKEGPEPYHAAAMLTETAQYKEEVRRVMRMIEEKLAVIRAEMKRLETSANSARGQARRWRRLQDQNLAGLAERDTTSPYGRDELLHVQHNLEGVRAELAHYAQQLSEMLGAEGKWLETRTEALAKLDEVEQMTQHLQEKLRELGGHSPQN